MPTIFRKTDKVRPAYDMAYGAVLFLCKLFLVVDTPITTIAVAGRYISFIPDLAWSEEVVLTCTSYMVVLLIALAIRRGAHIRTTIFNRYLPARVAESLDIIADLAVFMLAVITVTVGQKYVTETGSKGTYMSMPKAFGSWMYFPVPLANMTMLVFEVEALYNHVKSFLVKEGTE